MQFSQRSRRDEELSFEQLAQQLGLQESEYAGSDELKQWAQRHKNEKYVPEHLLKVWGFKVDQREI